MTGLTLVADTLAGDAITSSQDLLGSNIGKVVVFSMGIGLLTWLVYSIRGAFASAK